MTEQLQRIDTAQCRPGVCEHLMSCNDKYCEGHPLNGYKQVGFSLFFSVFAYLFLAFSVIAFLLALAKII